MKKLKKADMIMMIGLLYPKPTRVCKKILKNVTVFSRHNGIIVFSTVQNDMVYGDPLTDFIMRADGWNMCYKTDSEPDEIALESGWYPYLDFLILTDITVWPWPEFRII